ncbi:MAG: carbohydrate ABC transporter permease [Acidimicrobiia bacterium]
MAKERNEGKSGSDKAPWLAKERLAGVLFTAPAVILLAVFLVIPFVLAIWFSFTDKRLVSPLPTESVGFKNYSDTLTDPAFRKAFWNNVWFVLMVVPLQTALALFMAVLVNSKLRATKFFRSVYFLPVVIVMTVAAAMWLLIYDKQQGLANSVLNAATFGKAESKWLESTTMALPSILIMSIWQGAGFQMTILLAGLQGISPELYEASAIDGATPWQQFRHVTLPGLRNTLLFVVTVTTILAFRLFDQVWVMTRGAPLGNTSTMMLNMVETLNKNDVGKASAIAVIFFVIVLTLTLIQRAFVKEQAS